MRRSTTYRLIGVYTLVAITVSLGIPLAPLSMERAQYPMVLCSSIGVPGVPFRFSICSQKLTYTLGEVANVTLSTISTANGWLVVEDSMRLVISTNLQTAFSDVAFCGIPEGCGYLPGSVHSWVFHWKTGPIGNYVAVGTFATRVCSDGCGPPVALGSSTIGLSFDIVHVEE